MVAMDMVAMVTMAMVREKLKLMLSQAIIIMAILTDMVTDMATMDMERGKLMLSQAIIIMVTLMGMVTDMATMDMEREKLMLPLDITMDMAIMDMVDTDTMDMERGRPPPLIIVMILVDMIMALFISFVALTGICRNLLSRSTDLYLKKNHSLK